MYLNFKKSLIVLKVASVLAALGSGPALVFAKPAPAAEEQKPLQVQENAPVLKEPPPIRDMIDREVPTHNWSPEEAKKTAPNDDIAKVVPTKCQRPRGKFPWNLEKAKLEDVVNQISKLACKNFVLTKDLQSKEVSMISRTPITVDQAWEAFLSLLESNDLALVQVGEFNKIIQRKESSRQPLPVVDEKTRLPFNEGMVTYLHDIRHLPKDVALSLVKSLASKQGEVLGVGDGFLVISDGAANIRRVMSILDKVDIAGAANRINYVTLVHADAQQVQQKLTEIFDAKGSTSDQERRFNAARSRGRSGDNSANDTNAFSLQKIVADERTNKLIIIASEKAFERIKEMIDVLDSPSSDASTQGQINVYYVKNGDAKKIAATLSTVVQGNAAGRRGPPRGAFRDDGSLFEGDIRITADETTNAIVVVANPRDYRSISQVIAKLDKERIQVYVEAAILDIGLNDENNFGINGFSAIPDLAGGLGILGSPTGMNLATGLIGATMGAASGGVAGAAALASLPGLLGTFNFIGPFKDIGIGGVKMPGFGVVIEALQKYANIDVLSTPSLLTLDNEKAEMSVGERIPTVSGASTLGGTNGIPIQNVAYQDVKLKFSITPHVNDDNVVRLEIEQDVNELGGEINVLSNMPAQPRIRTKSAKTTVTAKDQQTIVIGGLISQSISESETKIPVWGDIPFFGVLGKRKSKKIEKKNLTLVMTAHVVRSEEDLRKIYERKMKEREEFGKLYFGDKIVKFDPHVDYDKKTGPVHRLLDQVNLEMQKAENGGPGLEGETVIKSQEKPGGLNITTIPDLNNIPIKEPSLPPPPEAFDEELLDEEFEEEDENAGAFENIELPPPPVEVPPSE